MCTDCPAGTYNNLIGAITCVNCPPGQFNDLTRQTECRNCLPGSFSGEEGATFCTSCPAGTFSNISGATSCTLCAPGSFSGEEGAVFCTSCPAGTFSNLTGATVCTDCPAGTFNNQIGRITCITCPPGTSQPLTGQTLCPECPPQSYQPFFGQTECLDCPPGTWNDLFGQTSCTECSLSISCPPDITVNTDPDLCINNTADIGEPVVTSTCPIDDLMSNPSGLYSIGLNTVVWMVTDVSGNSRTCSQIVTVIDQVNPTITCPGPQTTNLNAECALLTPNVIALTTASDACGIFSLTQSPPENSSTPSSHNNVQLVTLIATDNNGNTSSCTVTVTALDMSSPVVTTCPASRNINLDGNCGFLVPELTVEANAMDNCGFILSQSPTSGTYLSSAHNMTHIVNIIATDAAGNTGSCTVVLTAQDVSPPSISCPENTTISLNVNCQLVVPMLISGATINDNCSGITAMQSPLPGTLIVSGHNTTQQVFLTVTDAAGLSSACTVLITALDDTPPTITCPSNTTISLNNDCDITIPMLTSGVTVFDNCGINNTSQSPVVGTMISLLHNETQTVTITVTDNAGLSSSCTVILTAVDDSDPEIINCADDRVVLLDNNLEFSIPDLMSEVLVDDNCTLILSRSQTPPVGSTIQSSINQQHIVVISVTDDAGNTDQCEVTLTGVFDGSISIECPEDIVVELDDCECQIAVDFEVIATGIGQTDITYSHVPGSLFPVGTTVVFATATDILNNQATCTFEVTVEENERILVKGNGNVIENGSTSYSIINNTLFGSVALNGFISKTFTIENIGCGNLQLTGSPQVIITGAGAGYFNVTTQPFINIGSCSTVSFVITYTGSAVGIHDAIVEIQSDAGIFGFGIRAAVSESLMVVRGNFVNIPNGKANPVQTDNTDFGTINFNTTRDKTFVIHNLGTQNLILNGSPLVRLTGVDASQFQVVIQPSTSINPGSSVQFIVRFNGNSVGVFTAWVEITANDPGAQPYTFAIRGTILAPNMEVRGNNRVIVNGDDTPEAIDFTDFGVRNVGQNRSNSFVIRNPGSGIGILALTGTPRVLITGPDASQFTVTTQPVASIGINGQSVLIIRHNPTYGGIHNAMVSIQNNNPLTNPYTFAIRGSAIQPLIGIQLEENEAKLTTLPGIWQVYPNPTRGQLELVLDKVYEEMEIEIYDGMGALVLKQKLGSGKYHSLSLADISSGIYTIKALNQVITPIRFVKID